MYLKFPFLKMRITGMLHFIKPFQQFGLRSFPTVTISLGVCPAAINTYWSYASGKWSAQSATEAVY